MTLNGTLSDIMRISLFSIGEVHFTVGRLLGIVGALLVVAFLLNFLKRWILRRTDHYERERKGNISAVLNFSHYALLIIFTFVILQAGGVDLSALTLLTGALGIGIGFGLQAITNNLISGIIILFERPIKVGDRIDVGDVAGEVVSISVRATTILTNDNIAVIVPNSDFITQRVTNWSFNDRKVRFEIPVGVAYSSDPRKVEEALLAAEHGHGDILDSPEPSVLFVGFGESSLNFALRVWSSTLSDRPKALISQMNFKIFDEFKNRGVEIPFPQMDLHLKSGFDESSSRKI